MDPYIGTILLFAFPRIPTGWAACDGSLLAISEYEALFTLIGTTYGGNGVTNFALPDLRGRVPIHQGTGPGLSTRVLGQAGGHEVVTIVTSTMASHGHPLAAASATPPVGATATPDPSVLFGTGVGPKPYLSSITGATPEVMAPQTISSNAGGQAHQNMMPTLVGNYCIALYGIFPSQG